MRLWQIVPVTGVFAVYRMEDGEVKSPIKFACYCSNSDDVDLHTIEFMDFDSKGGFLMCRDAENFVRFEKVK